MGMLRYGYRLRIAIPAQHRTLFYGVTGMPVPAFWSCESVDMIVGHVSLLISDCTVNLQVTLLSITTYVAHPTPLPRLKSEREVSASPVPAPPSLQE